MEGQCGTIHLVPLRARELKSVQKLGKQDPYIRWTILPWDESVKTKALKGQNPVWEEDARHAWGSTNEKFLQYHGKPVDNVTPELLIEVYDREVTHSDRIIGSYTLDLRSYLRPYQPQVVEVQLKDKHEKNAGYVEFTFNFLVMGTLKLNLLTAKNLVKMKSTAHDTYIRTTLLPSEETHKSSHAKGKEPDWSEKRRNTLSFEVDGSVPPSELELDIEVIETHMMSADRVIGYKVIAVGQYVTMFGEEITHQLLVKLTDDKLKDCGEFRCSVSFDNDAHDPTKQVVAPKKGSFLVNSTKVLGAVSKQALNISKNVVDAMPVKREDVGQSMVDTFALSVAEVEQFEIFKALERRTHIPAAISAKLTVVCIMVFVFSAWVSYGAKLASLIIGVLFPCWKSFKALESPQKDDDTRWLTYWMIFGCLKLAEESLFAVFVEFNPSLYYFLKMVVLIWLVHPISKGSLLAYKYLIAPLLREYEDEIEDTIHNAKRWRFSTRSSRVSGDSGAYSSGSSVSRLGYGSESRHSHHR